MTAPRALPMPDVSEAWGSSHHLTIARPDHCYVDDDALAAMKARQQADVFGSSGGGDV